MVNIDGIEDGPGPPCQNPPASVYPNRRQWVGESRAGAREVADLNTGRPPTGMPEVQESRSRRYCRPTTALASSIRRRGRGQRSSSPRPGSRGSTSRPTARRCGIHLHRDRVKSGARQQQASVSRPSRHCPATSTRRQRRPTGPDGWEWPPQAPEDNAPNSADDELPLAAPEAGEAPRSDPVSKSRSGQPGVAADDDLSSAEMEQESRGWQIATGAETGTGRRPTGTPHQKERADVIQNRLLPQHK